MVRLLSDYKLKLLQYSKCWITKR